ncbi:DUF1963 domain-containing protein [Corynebacterium qintianiae]|uniref:DUF1963 domain-containing protein n=1 Tax=Corynebacterium qintianiae TaxID=2709392 RepID=UPI0013EDA7BF|nr:YwqG family protein [Corynebacterium qintianiae]
MFKDTKEVSAAAAAFLPAEFVGKALAYLIEEIGLEPGEVAEVPLGSSRVGGLPDLPKGAEWPAGPGGMSYAFIAQINLAELRDAVGDAPGLPESGLLSFFWDPEGGYDAAPENSRVIYTPDGELERLAFPEGLNALHESTAEYSEAGSSAAYAPPQPVSFYRGLAMPTSDVWVPEHEQKLGDLDDDNHPMAATMDEFLEFLAESTYFQYPDWKRYQILGAPCAIQPDPRIDANGGRPEGRLDWLLLLQVPLAAWEIQGGAEGDLYFLAHKDDVEKRYFSNVRVVYQQT